MPWWPADTGLWARPCWCRHAAALTLPYRCMTTNALRDEASSFVFFIIKLLWSVSRAVNIHSTGSSELTFLTSKNALHEILWWSKCHQTIFRQETHSEHSWNVKTTVQNNHRDRNSTGCCHNIRHIWSWSSKSRGRFSVTAHMFVCLKTIVLGVPLWWTNFGS